MINEIKNWLDFVIGLFECLIGRNVEIFYQFEDFEFYVFSSIVDDVEYVQWKMNGMLKIIIIEK